MLDNDRDGLNSMNLFRFFCFFVKWLQDFIPGEKIYFAKLGDILYILFREVMELLYNIV